MMMRGPSPTLVWNEHRDPIRNLYDPKSDIPPMWADILYSGIANRDKIKDTLKDWKDDPSLITPAVHGLMGQYLLNTMLPSNVNLDLKNKRLNYRASDKLNVGLSKKGDTSFLNLGWRF